VTRKITRRVKMIILLVIILFGTFPCYATTFTIDIAIKCSPTVEDAEWTTFPGSMDTQYSLTTRGIKVEGIPELVTYWSDELIAASGSDYVHILARCSSTTSHYSYGSNVWGPRRTCICRKGESLSVVMISPNDDNPDKYQYAGTLQITRDDEDGILKKLLKKVFLPTKQHVGQPNDISLMSQIIKSPSSL
jgi:hypothetical protein